MQSTPTVARRGPNARSARSIDKLMGAAIECLTEAPYSELTIRSVAARAQVSATTAYTYFPTKDALIARIFLRAMRTAEVFTDVNHAAAHRVSRQLQALTVLVADSPHLADACMTALMSDDDAVGPIRDEIAGEIQRRITASLGPGYPAGVASTLHMLFSGALMHARSGALTYAQVADQLAHAVAMILTPHHHST